MKTKFKVGDIVLYQAEEGEWTGPWVIEKEYEVNGLFFIGDKDSFCDMVPAHDLKEYKDG